MISISFIDLFSRLTAFQTEGKLYLILDFLRGGDVFTRLSKEVSSHPVAQHVFVLKFIVHLQLFVWKEKYIMSMSLY